MLAVVEPFSQFRRGAGRAARTVSAASSTADYFAEALFCDVELMRTRVTEPHPLDVPWAARLGRMHPSPPPARCPRCAGRMLNARDQYGAYSSCWQCGYVHEWHTGPPLLDVLPQQVAGVPRRHPGPSYQRHAGLGCV